MMSTRVLSVIAENGSAYVDSSIIGTNNIPKKILDFINLITISNNPIPYLPVLND